jgi:hypothetical protein
MKKRVKQWQKTRKLIGWRIKSIILFSVTSSLFAEISIRSRNFQFSLFFRSLSISFRSVNHLRLGKPADFEKKRG